MGIVKGAGCKEHPSPAAELSLFCNYVGLRNIVSCSGALADGKTIIFY